MSPNPIIIIYLYVCFPLREIEFFRWQSSVCPEGRKFDNNGRGINDKGRQKALEVLYYGKQC